jgi:hypothetical protein
VSLYEGWWYSSTSVRPAPDPLAGRYGIAGAVTGSQAGAPMVAIAGEVPPRLRAVHLRRPHLGQELATIEGAFGRQWQDELNEVGSASLRIGNEDPQSVTIREGDVVRFEDDGWATFAFLVREIERQQIAEGEEVDQVTSFTGPGLLAVMEEALVYPSNGLAARPVETDRYFSWQSPDYNDDWWGYAQLYPVVDGYQPGSNEWPVGMSPGDGMYAGVTNWPLVGCPRITAPGADYWLAPGGWSYMRKFFYIAPEDPVRTLVIYTVADDRCLVWFDGQKISETYEWSNSNSDLEENPVDVSPGWHVIAAAVGNSDLGPMWSDYFGRWINPWSFMCAVYRMNEDTMDREGNPILISDETWKGVFYPPHPPGWTPGQVLIRMFYEAQLLRGGLDGIGYTFTGEVDSAGTPWPEVGDIATKTGTDYLTFLKELAETYIDFWMEPGTLTLHAWVKGTRGSRIPDVSLHPPTDPNDPWSGNLAALSYRKVD